MKEKLNVNQTIFPFFYCIHINNLLQQHISRTLDKLECMYWTALSGSGGAKPEGHEDDHEMVNMEYACDHCQGLIVGSRINCNVCEDFDLCFGCYNAKKYPDR